MSLHAQFRGPEQEGEYAKVYLTIFNDENRVIFTACSEVEDDVGNLKVDKVDLMKDRCREYVLRIINEAISMAIDSIPVV